jgi:hypothetical protein
MRVFRTILVGVLAVGIVGLVVHLAVVRRPAVREVAHEEVSRGIGLEQPRRQTPPAAPTAPEPLPPEEVARSIEVTPPPESVNADGQPGTNSQSASAPAGRGRRPREELKDPVARVALCFVGADPDAEQYWIEAINDPSLSAHERSDLIEDLNEEGLADPRGRNAEDLPLIVSRILLIEEVAPYAMDQVNADAFLEAYKDLVNLFLGLTEP